MITKIVGRLPKHFFFLLFLLSGIGSSFGQDRIFLVNGNEVNVRVTGSDDNNILAKSMNSSDTRVYRYPKSQVERIEYHDGRVEYFSEKEESVESEEKFVPPPSKPPSASMDDIEIEEEKSGPSVKLGFSTGINSPLGKYGSSAAYNDGYARTGSFFKLEFSFMHPKWIGMGLNFGYASNAMKNSAVERKWEIPITGEYKAETTKYGFFYLMLGPQFSIRAEKNLYIDIKLRYGLTIISEPYYNVTFVDDSSGFVKKYQNENDSTNRTALVLNPVSFHLGTALRYNLSERMALSLTFTYMVSPLYFNSFQSEEWEENGLRMKNVREIEIIEFASMAHIGIGFHLLFGDND